MRNGEILWKIPAVNIYKLSCFKFNVLKNIFDLSVKLLVATRIFVTNITLGTTTQKFPSEHHNRIIDHKMILLINY